MYIITNCSDISKRYVIIRGAISENRKKRDFFVAK